MINLCKDQNYLEFLPAKIISTIPDICLDIYNCCLNNLSHITYQYFIGYILLEGQDSLKKI